MSDLDDFFAKRLDEEANFPNRGKNWKQLSKQLDAFHSGSVQGNRPGLRGWQIATFAAVAVAGLLLWKTFETLRENKNLRQDVATLQTTQTNLMDQLAAAEKRAVLPVPEVVPDGIPSGKETAANTHGANLAIAEKSNIVPSFFEKKRSGAITPVANAPVTRQSTNTNSEHAPENDLTASKVEEKTAVSGAPVFQNNATDQLDTVAAKTTDITQGGAFPDSVENKSTPKDSVRIALEKPKDSIAVTTPSIAQEIKPLHLKKSRFRIGTQATIGFVQPKQKGVSALRGQGFTAETKVFRSLWLTASVDWLHHEVCTEGFVPKFHPFHDSLPEPHGNGGGGGGGPQHESKLVKVESAPREQHFGLGFRYKLPVQFWVRPSLRVAHEWVRMSPSTITYQYEEEDQGGPGPGQQNHHSEFTTKKFDKQWLNNQWRFGIGLEKDIPNWTFSLWADYSKDFSTVTPSFDVLYLRGGAQYRF